MLPFYHDKRTVAESCNIDGKNYIEFQMLIHDVYMLCMMKKECPSMFIEKLENMILKDTENRLRMFLFGYYCFISDKFEMKTEGENANGQG